MEDAPSDAPITVLMTDVEGSTDLHTRLGDASARELIRRHETLIRAALAAHGGHEVKTMGDGFLADFITRDEPSSSRTASAKRSMCSRAWTSSPVPWRDRGGTTTRSRSRQPPRR